VTFVTRSAVDQKKYLELVSYYESCLERHGDTHLGVDWPNRRDLDTRCRVMLDVIRSGVGPVRLLDFGCGTSYLLEYIVRNGISGIEYTGLDLSPKFIQLSQSKFPMNQYYCLDILDSDAGIPRFDYVVMNGVFTERRGLSFEEMFAFVKRVLIRIFQSADVGIAFNVMSAVSDTGVEQGFCYQSRLWPL
jgi:SAM-dependent methyltransferase